MTARIKEYKVGEIWEITGNPETSLIPPHNENFVVHNKSPLHATKDMKDLVSAIELLMPPKTRTSTSNLYEGLLQNHGVVASSTFPLNMSVPHLTAPHFGGQISHLILRY